jgi:hypothetical protein
MGWKKLIWTGAAIMILGSGIAVRIFCFPSEIFAESNGSLILERRRVGEIKVGMTPNDIYKTFGKKRTRLVDRELEGTYSPAIELFKTETQKGSPEIIFELGQNRVYRIEVHSSQYRTAEGIGVGSTMGDLRRVYGIHDPEQIIWGEEGFFGVVIRELGMSFRLDVNKTMKPAQIDDFLKNRDPRQIPDNTRIEIVLVFLDVIYPAHIDRQLAVPGSAIEDIDEFCVPDNFMGLVRRSCVHSL